MPPSGARLTLALAAICCAARQHAAVSALPVHESVGEGLDRLQSQLNEQLAVQEAQALLETFWKKLAPRATWMP